MEHYRLGLQFQYKTGKWSQPIFINDYQNDEQIPSLDPTASDPNGKFFSQKVPTFTASMWESCGQLLYKAGYRRVRGVVCFPKESDQLILCQGLLNPTVYSISGYVNHAPDRQSSWFFRPIPKNASDTTNSIAAAVQWQDGKTLFSGNETQGIPSEPFRGDEIQGVAPCFSNKQAIV